LGDFFTNKSVYLGNSARYGHSYYRSGILGLSQIDACSHKIMNYRVAQDKLDDLQS